MCDCTQGVLCRSYVKCLLRGGQNCEARAEMNPVAPKKSRAARHLVDNERFRRRRDELEGGPTRKRACDDDCDEGANNIDPGQTLRQKKVR